jgi:hypothetical protein
MRRFAARPAIAAETLTRLQEKTDEVLAIANLADRRARARAIYEVSRGTLWFGPIVDALRGLCGPGELCMYCSSNEPSQLEHFRPLTVFPDRTFEYNNYLWSCDICNRTHKGERFPPDTGPGEQILNPLDDDVWEFFFIEDQFGRLLRRVDPGSGAPLGRATSTCEIVGIDRENVQIKRSRRFRNLRRDVERALDDFHAGTVDAAGLQALITEWLSEPFQSDVADYFLNGPGRDKEPFASLFAATED